MIRKRKGDAKDGVVGTGGYPGFVPRPGTFVCGLLIPTRGPLIPTRGPLIPTRSPLTPTRSPLTRTRSPLIWMGGPRIWMGGPRIWMGGPRTATRGLPVCAKRGFAKCFVALLRHLRKKGKQTSGAMSDCFCNFAPNLRALQMPSPLIPTRNPLIPTRGYVPKT